MHLFHAPRIVIAGLTGDSGKSLVSLGLIRHFTRLGRRVAPFKKGPDYIDAAWLGRAAGVPGRNLDTFFMDPGTIKDAFTRAAGAADLSIVEGNRGLYDGLTADGAHSTAALARILDAPVVLVVRATKVTRTVAAMVLGCRDLEPDINLAGVILNAVGTARQEAVIRQAIVEATGIPVLGAIPRLSAQHLPSRHLGLVTASEHGEAEAVLDALADEMGRYVDTERLATLASNAPPLDMPAEASPPLSRPPDVTIGVLRDRAFSFYYPENLEALEAAGARLSFISPIADTRLPSIDALYAGGGFPEVHAAALSRNEALRNTLARCIDDGLPVWAECGGLMYLARAILQDGEVYPMVGALPFAIEQTRRPQGHGYVRATVDRANPYLPTGLEVRGHEFHYSRLVDTKRPILLPTALNLSKGTGVGNRRDGLIQGAVFAGYTHIHALGTPEWAPAVVDLARGRAPGGG